MSDALDPRDRCVLEAVVEEYVSTAEPVGSRNLTRKYGLGVSPATVRNVMADLEERGYLSQPHVSAGRQPTDAGYRYYVDHLRNAERVDAGARRRLRRLIGDSGRGDIEELLAATSAALSSAAGQVGVVVAPRFESRIFHHIDFVLLRRGLVLVVLVSRSGVVHHHPVRAPEIQSQAELDRMANYLNEALQDMPLGDVRDRILAEMASESAAYDDLLRRALQLGHRAVTETPPDGDIYFGDPATLLVQPEFHQVGRMRSIFEAFQKKGMILQLLDRAACSPGIQVTIGMENALADLQECAVVSTTYGPAGRTLGTLGVIGPKRMEYARVIGLVNYTARLLGQMMEDA